MARCSSAGCMDCLCAGRASWERICGKEESVGEEDSPSCEDAEWSLRRGLRVHLSSVAPQTGHERTVKEIFNLGYTAASTHHPPTLDSTRETAPTNPLD